MTYKEWAERPDLVANLRLLLSDSTMQLALSVLTDHGLPKTKYTASTPNLLENNALLNAKREGYFEFLRNLKSLSVEPKKLTEENNLVPWKYASEPEEK
jgi:hypothetical protein